MMIRTQPFIPQRPATLSNNPQPPEQPEPVYNLDKAAIVTIGSSLANGTTAGVAAGVGSLIPNTGFLTAVAAGLAGGVVGAVVGSVVNYKAIDIAESRYPSRNMYGLVTMGLGVASSIGSGVVAGVAGHYGANPLIAGGVAAGGTAIGLKLMF